MFGHSLRKRGVAMVEYAVLLAFVTAIGGLFMDDSKLSAAFSDVIDKAVYIVANGELKSKYRYNVQVATESDKKYVDALNRIINGVYDELSKDGKPLRDVWITTDGKIKNYTLYKSPTDSNLESYTPEHTIDLNDFLPADSKYSMGGSWESHIQFDLNGNVDSWSNTEWNDTTRIYFTDKDTGFNDIGITYNTTEKKLSETPDYWK